MSVQPEICFHCHKVVHRETFEGHTFLVDDETGGDVCGSYATFGNEPHQSGPGWQCTECDTLHLTFADAAACHHGIGGVIEVEAVTS